MAGVRSDSAAERKTRSASRGAALVLLISAVFPAATVANSPPRFLTDGQAEIVLRLKEGPETPVGSLLYRLRGVDTDGDSLTFGVREQPDSDILRIENFAGNQASIYLRKPLDREEKEEYTLVLTLTDGHLGDGNYVTQSLFILVEDINDNEPVFKPYQPTISIEENSPPGIITTVEATDRDEGSYGQVVYHLQETDGDNDVFSISTVNGKGVIRLSGHLDYERKFLYQLRVLATDRANNEKVNTGTAAILVKVIDMEDQPPEFVYVPPVTRVSEDAVIGTSVLQVKAVDGDRGINNKISYSLEKGTIDAFAIDSATGVVYTKEKLDRESPLNSNGAYILEVTAEEESSSISPAPSATTEVTVIVTDVNDEIPTFRSEKYVCEVVENAQSNTPVTFLEDSVPEVYDHDQGNNGTFEMFLEGDEGIFEVTPSRGINEASFLIRVKDPKQLDYEKNVVMHFTLIAKEIVPYSPKHHLVPVTVHIKDVNDNFPEFTKAVYNVSIKENAAIGTTVAWVQALDDDSGNLGSQGIRYTSLGGSVSEILSLDPVTGIITIKSDTPGFDRELISKHYLTVEARDDLGNGNRNTVQLIINVEDENDNAPVFSRSKYEARLLENHPVFETPLVLEAHDMDLNGTNNSDINYSIISGYENFTIHPKHGLLQPRFPVDFEHLSTDGLTGINVRTMNVIVKAEDRGHPSLSSEVGVIIYVQDVNDFAPQFEHPHYKRSIPEDTLGGTSILKVKAVDGDGSSPNNAVVYRIQSGAEDKFIIDADTGVISVAHGASLDPDRTDPKTSVYNLEVLALDGGIGNDQLFTKVVVNITVLDVNNKPPVFTEPGVIRVRENTQVGKYVHQVTAIDLDDNPILRYRIDPNNSEGRSEEGTVVKITDYNYISIFKLDPLNGLLEIAKLLDRERVETIRLGLIVEDIAAVKGEQNATAVLTVLVEDENDNNPKFRRPYYRRSITENSKNGMTIINVVADDPDKNRTITYSLEGPHKSTSLVYLDPETGEIVVANKIDREQTPWLNFTVKATDSGVPPRSSLADVFIQILDENDNNPYFVGDVTSISVREDAPIGTEIAIIQAKDADAGDFGKVTYLLDRMSSKGKFQIHPDNGILNVSDKLDREQQSSYMLIIEAWDNYQFGYSSGESRNAFKQIGVTVIDVNDESPIFEPVYGCIIITEFHEVHEVVTLIKASDADDPDTPNGKIHFSITSGNAKGLFAIENLDFLTGRIITLKPLKGLYGNYSLRIQAKDLGTPPNIAVMNISICVTDFNDNAPVFVNPSQNVTVRVPENTTVGSSIVQVEAVDYDVGLNAAVRYRLKPDPTGSWKTFHINDKTGVIELKEPLDREKQKIYELRVEAYDLGIPTPLSSDLDLIVYVRNVNDFEPQFLIDEYLVNFTEHVTPGKERQKLVETIDRDDVDDFDEPRTQACYFIVGGNEKDVFAIEQYEHELYVQKELDREEYESHILIIKASEDCLHHPGNISVFDPTDDTVLRVTVNVIDVNDNRPLFVKRVFTGGITTDADFGTEFMQVKAVDKDIGINAEIRYYQIDEIHKTLTEGLENIQKPPFIVNEETGGIILNFDPQKGMKGYFDFMVLVNDTDGLLDTAKVFIYLLREDQRVQFVLRQHPSEVRERIEIFREVLGNVTGAIVNIDEYKIHENHDGSVDKTKTDLYLHLVNKRDNSIMEVNDVLRLVDQNIENLDGLFKDFNVLDTQPAETQLLKSDSEDLLLMWLMVTTIFLGILLILVISICLSQRARYQRQIKAATVSAFGSNTSDLNQIGGRVPNTNKHSVEGSNPIWMQAYENEWYKEEDSLSHTSERDSLDENAVVSDGLEQNEEDSKTFVDDQNHYVNLKAGNPNIVSETAIDKEQNNLNTNSTYHQNIYHHMSKLGNPLIMKKLETTEL
ncbi:cadherin-23-like [Schistocerca cancellata]|uniref:cadherin-23-like n=1 Tax=Schistocerca cancellata TaxID=274614 RepID=UPI002117BE9C|nr:cadherin-23-like [Schistocerca cancellata]